MKQRCKAKTCAARPPLEPPPSSFYAQLIRQLDALGWQRVHWLCPNLSAVHLRISDAAGEISHAAERL